MVTARVLANAFVFVLTGAGTTLLSQMMFYQGASGGGRAMITALPNYLGMCLTYFASSLSEGPKPTRKRPSLFADSSRLLHAPHAKILSSCLVDLLGNCAAQLGIFLTGSSVYQVMYSSVVIFNAILSKLILKRPIHYLQWVAVFVVSLGLSFSALDQLFGSIQSSRYGMVFCMLSPMFYAFNYIQNEILIKRYLKPSTAPISAAGDDLDNRDISLLLGIYSSTILLIYISLYTIPNWNELMAVPIEQQGGSYLVIAGLFFSMMICAFLHNVTYVVLMGKLGSLSTGIMHGLRAITVFVGSAVLFCDPVTSPGQCFTFEKLVSSSIVIFGVILFSSARPKDSPAVVQKPSYSNAGLELGRKTSSYV